MSKADLARRYKHDHGTIRRWLEYYDLEAKSGYGSERWKESRGKGARINREETAQEMIELARRWK